MGSEMCIRDRFEQLSYWGATVAANISDTVPVAGPLMKQVLLGGCLLYTSDAADDLLCVDLGGRRIIKKKKNKITTNWH